MKLQSIDHLNLSVSSLKESETFYRELFGFSVVERGSYEGTPWAIVRSGDSMLCMYEKPGNASPDTSTPGHHRINHFGFRVADGGAFEDLLKSQNVPLEYGSNFRRPHSTSWYVRDPSGHTIEVTEWDDDIVSFENLS